MRQLGLKAADLDPIGKGYLDLFVRSMAKVELADRWLSEHGLLKADGEPMLFGFTRRGRTAPGSRSPVWSSISAHATPRRTPRCRAISTRPMATTKARAASLVAACDDAKLLGFPLWPTQRSLMESVEQHRTNVRRLGRRSGKTTAAALVGVHACTLRPELRAHLRPGERGYAVAIAVNLRQARLIVSAARSIGALAAAFRACRVRLG